MLFLCCFRVTTVRTFHFSGTNYFHYFCFSGLWAECDQVWRYCEQDRVARQTEMSEFRMVLGEYLPRAPAARQRRYCFRVSCRKHLKFNILVIFTEYWSQTIFYTLRTLHINRDNWLTCIDPTRCVNINYLSQNLCAGCMTCPCTCHVLMSVTATLDLPSSFLLIQDVVLHITWSRI